MKNRRNKAVFLVFNEMLLKKRTTYKPINLNEQKEALNEATLTILKSTKAF
jgi:hypothetical protein